MGVSFLAMCATESEVLNVYTKTSSMVNYYPRRDSFYFQHSYLGPGCAGKPF